MSGHIAILPSTKAIRVTIHDTTSTLYLVYGGTDCPKHIALLRQIKHLANSNPEATRQDVIYNIEEIKNPSEYRKDRRAFWEKMPRELVTVPCCYMGTTQTSSLSKQIDKSCKLYGIDVKLDLDETREATEVVVKGT